MKQSKHPQFWQTKEFKTAQAMQAWLDKNEHLIQWNEVFINNAYGLEYRGLILL